jgi:hypothetical protein
LVLDRLAQWRVETGGRLVKHARHYWLLSAESHLTRRLFAGMLGRIVGLLVPTGSPGWGSREINPEPPGRGGV